LEAQLVKIAQTVGRYRLENGNNPRGGADLPEADASDMDYFIDQIRILLPVLGHDIVRGRVAATTTVAGPGSLGTARSSGHGTRDAEVVAGSADAPAVAGVASAPEGSPVFRLRTRSGVDARAQVVDGEFTVLTGSDVVARMLPPAAGASSTTQGQYDSRSRLHADMVRGAEPKGGDLCTLLKDVVFTSPSAAASVVQGRGSANGKTMWKTEDGHTFGEWLDSQA
jgi:hypothetical protein